MKARIAPPAVAPHVGRNAIPPEAQPTTDGATGTKMAQMIRGGVAENLWPWIESSEGLKGRDK